MSVVFRITIIVELFCFGALVGGGMESISRQKVSRHALSDLAQRLCCSQFLFLRMIYYTCCSTVMC